MLGKEATERVGNIEEGRGTGGGRNGENSHPGASLQRPHFQHYNPRLHNW